MGVVYEAYDALAREVVALKTLIRTEATELYQLKNEFRSLADIAHPNLVNLFELFVEADVCFFTMELVDGEDFVSYATGRGNFGHVESSNSEETLPLTWPLAERSGSVPHSSEIIRARPSLPMVECPVNAVRVWPALRQLVEGLCALHEGGKVHRDIKPSNILVTRAGRVVILDFGLATELNPTETRSTHGLIGTPAYMAPEQATGGALSPASDWYGVGITLYQVLSGQLPFLGSYLDIILQQQNSDPIAPCQLANNVPTELEELCLALLRREPQARRAF
jgi:eukaryotic-like serine/threonine-protein kinase